MAIKSCWYRPGGKESRVVPGAPGLRSRCWPLHCSQPPRLWRRPPFWGVASEDKSCSNAGNVGERTVPIFHFTRTWKCLLFLAHFWAPKSEGVAAPKPSDEVAIEAFAKIDVSADISASWLTTHSQRFCGLAYQCADFLSRSPWESSYSTAQGR